MTAAKHHKTVAVIERYYEVGGGTTHWGTIPSKALRHAAKILHDVRRNPLLREFSDVLEPDVSAAAVDGEQGDREPGRHASSLLRAQPRAVVLGRSVVRGREYARSAAGERQAGRASSGRHIVIAAGSRPYHPPDSRFHARARLRQRHDPALRRASVLGHDLRRRRHRLRVRLDLREPRRQGDAGQHAGQVAVVSRRRDRRGAVLSPARAGLRDSPQRAVQGARSARARRRAASGVGPQDQVRRAAVGERPHRQLQCAQARERWAHQQPARADRRQSSVPDVRAAHLCRRRHRRSAGAGERRLRAGLARGRAHSRSATWRRIGWR